jgi:hypothetical protein
VSVHFGLVPSLLCFTVRCSENFRKNWKFCDAPGGMMYSPKRQTAGVTEAGDVSRVAICLVQHLYISTGNDQNNRYLACNLRFVLLHIVVSV